MLFSTNMHHPTMVSLFLKTVSFLLYFLHLVLSPLCCPILQVSTTSQFFIYFIFENPLSLFPVSSLSIFPIPLTQYSAFTMPDQYLSDNRTGIPQSCFLHGSSFITSTVNPSTIEFLQSASTSFIEVVRFPLLLNCSLDQLQLIFETSFFLSRLRFTSRKVS
eukprot:c28270_g1_i2 orf=533-1018(+)